MIEIKFTRDMKKKEKNLRIRIEKKQKNKIFGIFSHSTKILLTTGIPGRRPP